MFHGSTLPTNLCGVKAMWGKSLFMFMFSQYTIEGSNFVLYKNFWVWIKVMGFLVEPETQYFVYNNDTKG